MKKPQVVMMALTLPTDVPRCIEARAAANLAPMNSAIVSALRAQMDAERSEKAG